MSKIKICGITNLEDALFCADSGADALGFIFFKKSPRFITPKQAFKIIKSLNPFVSTVGVFVDEDQRVVEDTASSLGLDILQFHGSETKTYCNYFKSKYKVIKTFFPDNDGIGKVSSYRVNACLFDVKLEEKQLGKKSINPMLLKEIKMIKNVPVIISGGLNPKNVSSFISKVNPYAVDVSSGVESIPGKKDKKLVSQFIKLAKKGS